MKIAIDVREANGEKTGKGFFAYGLVKELLELDRENTYVLYTDKSKVPFKEYKNVEAVTINEEGMKWHLQVLKDIIARKPDIYIAPTSFIVPSLAPKWLKTYVVVHDLVAFLYPKTHSKKAMIIERLTLKRALKKAEKVLVVSENTQNDLVKQFNFPKSLIVEVPCAPHDLYKDDIDPKESEKVRAKYKLPEKYILGVGTLEPRKNFSTLIKSFVSIKRKFPEYKLVIVGKEGWKHQELKRTVKEFELSEDVVFTGYMKDEDLHHTYHLAEVFVFPSLYEGFGIPPLEAMASGCPVVASNAASLPEVVGDAGLLIEPTNSHKIADAVIDVIENPQVRNMLIERGFFRSQKYSWVDSARIVLEELQKEQNKAASKAKTEESPEAK